MADVKWIKITTDVFDDEKILLIESLPDADSIIVIWFKLLCLAGKQNNSGVFLLGDKIAYTDKMLATIFRRKESTVQLALKTFEEFGMIELIDGVITIPNWGKHQNLEQIEARKEYQKEYQREYRKKQKLLAESDDNKHLRKHLHKQNVNSLEEDIEEELEGRIRNNNTHSSTKHAEYGVIVEKFNEICVSLPSVTILSDKRKKAMDKVFIKDSVIHTEDVDHLFLKVEASDFLTGRTGTWKANFDWVINSTNIAKVLDGNYDNRTASKPAQGYKKQRRQMNLMIFTRWLPNGQMIVNKGVIGVLIMDRKPMIHELKILPEYFNEVQSHNKQFELRKDDRDYRVGDWILLKEFENGSYTGRECGCFGITYILRNCPEYGLADGYCILGW